MKKWVAVKFNNLETKLKQKIDAKGYQLKRIQIPPNVSIQLEVDLDDELYKKIAVNPTFVQRLQSTGLKLTETALDEVATLIMQQDARAGMLGQRALATFSRDITTTTNAKLTQAGNKLAQETEKMFEDLKRTQKELLRYRVKAGCKIGLSAISIGGGIAVSLSTAGAISPLGALAIARSGVQIAQEIAKLALDCDKIDKLIKADFAVLKKVMNPDIRGAGNMARGAQGAKEIGMNIFARTTGVETTSLANLKKRIDLYHVSVGKLDKESAKLSEKVYGIMDCNKQLETTVNAAKRTMPADQVGRLTTKLQKAELELDKLLKNIIKINEAIDRANKNHPAYVQAHTAMSSGIPGWITKVDWAIGLGMDIAVGIHDAQEALEKGLGAMVGAITAIADEFAIDPVGDKIVKV